MGNCFYFFQRDVHSVVCVMITLHYKYSKCFCKSEKTNSSLSFAKIKQSIINFKSKFLTEEFCFVANDTIENFQKFEFHKFFIIASSFQITTLQLSQSPFFCLSSTIIFPGSSKYSFIFLSSS